MTATRPASATNNVINGLGVAAFFAMLYYVRTNGIAPVPGGLLAVGAYAVVVLLLEVLYLNTPTRASTGLDFSRRITNVRRIALKVLGFYGTVGTVALAYWLFPEYHFSLVQPGFYTPVWDAATLIGPYVLALGVPYIVFVDERMREPEDGYYHYGLLLLGQWRRVNRAILRQHVLGWVVKGFFLPLMWVSFQGNINHLSRVNIDERLSSFMGFYQLMVDYLFTLDLLAAVAGYALAFRLFDTHFRSAEPTMAGWFVCTLCYPPFLSIYINLYLAYGPNKWDAWLADSPTLQIIWGSAALFLLLCYTLASINFGCRFSNLTHRGVLTKGMYRFTKHPAYVAKNLFWWMTYVPFIPLVSWDESLRFSVLLFGINTVYYLRARTEERHLSRDPAYVEYALYMNEHSMFRGLAKRLPWLKYKAPEGWEKLPRPYMGIKG